MTFKELSFKEKTGHIWYYYKGLIIGGAFFALVLGSLIYTIFIKTPVENYCGIAVYDQFMSMEDSAMLIDEINKAVPVPENNSVQIQSFYTDKNDVTVQAELTEKFNTYLFARELHILLSTQKNAEDFYNAGYAADLKEYLGEQRLKDRNTLSAKDGTVYAVEVTDSELLKQYNLFKGEKIYLALAPFPDYKEKTANVFDVMVGYTEKQK